MANYSFGRGESLPPIVKNLLIINVLAFVAQMVFENSGVPVNDMFALHHYKAEVFKPYQIVTHMFMHGGFFHLFFNMFALYMFGGTVERVWGPKRFLIFYLACGLGAAIIQLASYAYDYREVDAAVLDAATYAQYQTVLSYNATVGASGAIMGVLAAFGYLFPNTQLIIFPIPIPIKAKWAIAGLIAIDIFGGFAKLPNDNIAHFAHIGGALTGIIMLIIWNKTDRKTFY